MNILLDTNAFLWAIANPKKIPQHIADIIIDPSNTVYYSVVNVWEVSIKRALGKLNMPNNIEQEIKIHDFSELQIKTSHVSAVELLPPIHKDPFDRMLVAQAIIEKLTIVTGDKNILKYDIKTLEV